jgi:hypothetical protein
MKLFNKSLALAAFATVAALTGSVSQAATPYVFGKEPVARHNRAVLARKAQAQASARMSNMPRTYTTAPSYSRMTVPQMANRTYVTPVAGYRWSTASNNGAVVR